MAAAIVRTFCVAFLLLAVVADGANTTRSSQKVTPVEKVIELLKRLEVEVQEEGKKEAADYDKFACFCKEQADNKLYAIEKSEKKLEKLAAEIAKLEAEIGELNGKISDLAKQIAELDEEIKAISAVRAKEHEGYLAEAADMDGAIDAIQRAIKALKDSKEQMTDAKLNLVQIRSLLRVIRLTPSLKTTDAQVHAVQSLLGEAQPGQPAAYVYHSNDIIATLESLLVQFKELKKELDENEFQVRAAFEKNKLNLENEKKFAEQDKAEAEEILAEKEDLLKAAQKDQAQEKADKEADQAFLGELTETCETKAQEFDQRSSTRSAELSAIAEAIRALESGVKPNYGANKKLVDLQKKARAPASHRAVSFLQRDTSVAVEATPARRVLELLSSTARRLNSPLLSSLALKVRVSEDHFVKVRGLIKDLIAKLEADAEAEAETKSFCDTEMKKAIEARDDANAKLEETAAAISSKETQKALLEQDIAELGEQIAELQKALKEATELRAEERAANEKTIADATAGKEAVEFALNILQEFYSGAAFLQGKYVPPNADREGNTVSDLAPDVFEGEYKGRQDAAKGIIGILEIILSDFERTIDKVGSEEKEAQADFEKFEEETNADIDAKEKEKKEKETEVAVLVDEIAGLQDEQMDAKKLLETSLSELEKLKTMCVEGEETWEERKAKREQEIEALKEALTILENWQS